MARSSATTVEAYLAELPEDRRETVAAVRRAVLDRLPDGYQERMNWGMISYEVPLERYPDTYNGQPLMYAALAAQKRGYTLYLMNEYADGGPALREGFERAGKKLDMGKSCVRFRRLEDLPLDVIGDAIARTPVDAFIGTHEAARSRGKA
jgi:hypothetical protein